MVAHAHAIPSEIHTISRWLIYLHLGSVKFGESGFEKRLRDLCGFGDVDHHHQIKDRIFTEISSAYGVPKKTIIKSNKRGVVAEARTMAIILLHRHLRLSQADIGHIFGVGNNLVSMRIKAFETCQEEPLTAGGRILTKMYSNKDFIRNYETINETLYKFRAQWQK